MQHVESCGTITVQLSEDEVVEYLAGDWTDPSVDMATVANPGDAILKKLSPHGFVLKPSWVTWLACAGSSDNEFLQNLSRNERNNVRQRARKARGRGLEFRFSKDFTRGQFEEFLALYERQVDDMRNGVPFALKESEKMWSDRDRYLLVGAYEGSQLVCGCLCLIREEKSTLEFRFNASTAEARKAALIRPVYMRAVAVARELDLELVSLGTDPALYGVLTRPGLFQFKIRFGFVAVPSHWYLEGRGGDEAMLICHRNGLSDPALVVRYGGNLGAGELAELGARFGDEPASLARRVKERRMPLRLDIFSSSADESVSHFNADFLEGIVVRAPVSGSGSGCALRAEGAP